MLILKKIRKRLGKRVGGKCDWALIKVCVEHFWKLPLVDWFPNKLGNERSTI